MNLGKRNDDGTFTISHANTTRDVVGVVYEHGKGSPDQKSPYVAIYWIERPEDAYGLDQCQRRTLVVHGEDFRRGKERPFRSVFGKALKISQVIAQLEKAKAKHGDIGVCSVHEAGYEHDSNQDVRQVSVEYDGSSRGYRVVLGP